MHTFEEQDTYIPPPMTMDIGNGAASLWGLGIRFRGIDTVHWRRRRDSVPYILVLVPLHRLVITLEQRRRALTRTDTDTNTERESDTEPEEGLWSSSTLRSLVNGLSQPCSAPDLPAYSLLDDSIRMHLHQLAPVSPALAAPLHVAWRSRPRAQRLRLQSLGDLARGRRPAAITTSIMREERKTSNALRALH